MVVRKDAQLAVILLGLIPIMAVLVFLVMSKGVPLFKGLQEKLDRLNLVVREQLMGCG